VIRSATSLTTLTPINANFNPADARIDEDKYHLASAIHNRTAWGHGTQASYATPRSRTYGRFAPDLSGAADTQNQHRYIGDGYLDSHLTNTPHRS